MDVEASPFGKRESSDKKDQRRPDLIIYNNLGKRGSALAVDISIANPFSKVGGVNPKPLAAAALSREVEKVNKYAADCSKLNLNFHPLVLDAYGGIPPSTVHHVLNPLPSTGSRTLCHPTEQHHQPRPTGTRGSL